MSVPYSFHQFWPDLRDKSADEVKYYIGEQKQTYDYGVSLDEYKLLEADVDTFYSLYENNTDYFKAEDKKRHLYYLYLLCYRIRQFNHQYDKKSEVEKYEKRCKILEAALGFAGDECVSLCGELNTSDKVLQYLGLSKLKGYVSQVNLYRIYWIFCRLMVKASLLMNKELKLLDKLDKLFSDKFHLQGFIHTNFDDFSKIIDGPVNFLNVLSVGFYAARFIFDFSLMVKHVFLADKAAKEQSTYWQRFKKEMDARGFSMLNNVVWGSINLITNYYQLFRIPATTASYIVAGVLIFDVALLMASYYKDRYDYNKKRILLGQQLNNIRQEIGGLAISNSVEEQNKRQYLIIQQDIISQQLRQLEDQWQVTTSVYLFNTSAAVLLLAGFTTMLFVTGFAVLPCLAVCVLACAMYASDGALGEYKKVSINYQRIKQQGNPGALQLARREKNQAMKDFSFTLLENTIMPTLLLTSFAICWQAALVLTVLYIGYKIAKYAYDKNKKLPADSESAKLKKLSLFAYPLKASNDEVDELDVEYEEDNFFDDGKMKEGIVKI